MQFLLLLKQTSDSQDRRRVIDTGDDYSFIDLGTFYDLIFNHDEDSNLSLAVKWSLRERRAIKDPNKRSGTLFNIDKIVFDASIKQLDSKLVVQSFTYKAGSRSFGMTLIENDKPDKYQLTSEGFELKRTAGRPWPLPAPVKCYGFPNEATAYFKNTGFLPDLALAFEQMCDSISYLGPLRDDPSRSYQWGGDTPADVGNRGQLAVAALLAARTSKLVSGRGKGTARRYESIESRVLHWLREMKMLHTISLEPIGKNRKDYEFQIRRSAGSPLVNITDVGFGISQVLPVLVLCYYAPEGSTIILEQPEIHLHPLAQAVLADVFIDVAVERDLQIIFESHSEHLVRRLQRRIAEGAFAQEKTALYFCETKFSESKIRRIELDKFGRVKNWPTDFFGDTLNEAYQMNLSIARRSTRRKKTI